jgi:hypothetical protein
MQKPEIVIHRVNKCSQLKNISPQYGVEVDLRAEGSSIILNHNPFAGGEKFVQWLECYNHGLLVCNVKEAGIEEEVVRLCEARGIKRFFLLDVEFPYIYRASRKGEKRIAMRFSEDEAIETVLNYKGKVSWVWIDTNTKLPLNEGIVMKLQGFQSCLVCPERWGRPGDIYLYREKMSELDFLPDAVMTSLAHAHHWRAEL